MTNKNLKISENNSIITIKSPKINNKNDNKNKSSRDIMNCSKIRNSKKSLPYSSSNRLFCFSSVRKTRQGIRNRLKQGDMSHKNRKILYYHRFPFKMIEKHKAEIKGNKANSEINLTKNSVNIKNSCSKINKEEIKKNEDEKEHDIFRENLEQKLEEKMQKEIEMNKKEKMNIIISKLKKPFLCCLKW